MKRYKEHQRERFLFEEEVARLGEILWEAEEEMPSAVAAFRRLLLTGCRMSEIRDLQWENVKGDCISTSNRDCFLPHLVQGSAS